VILFVWCINRCMDFADMSGDDFVWLSASVWVWGIDISMLCFFVISLYN